MPVDQTLWGDDARTVEEHAVHCNDAPPWVARRDGLGGEKVASMSTPPPAIAHSPKFHRDRGGYADALREWCTRQLPGAEDVAVGDVDIPAATGFSNETIFFDVEWTDAGGSHHERFVGRIEPPTGALFPTQTSACTVSVELQQRVMRAVAEHGVPMCPIVGYESDAGLLGQPFFVMGFVDGHVPSDVPRYTLEGFLVEEATPEERHQLVRTGLEAMAGVHAIDWREADLGWLDASGVGEPTLAVQLDLYRRFATEQLAGRAHPQLFRAFDWLAAHDPHDERVGLAWGDSRLGNIIFRDYRPAVVCDWEAAALSPTEADLGWWLMYDRMSFEDLGAARMQGFPTREEMVRIYEDASGREVREPAFWEIFGSMRYAAIMVPLADRMTAAGLVPADRAMATDNYVVESLTRLLDDAAP
jgi:aminoglycoside phosphotransferase (APT) family kinase protein